MYVFFLSLFIYTIYFHFPLVKTLEYLRKYVENIYFVFIYSRQMESVKIKQEPQDPPDIFADVDMRGIPRREWLRQNIPNFPSAANVELGDIVTIKTEIKQEVVYFFHLLYVAHAFPSSYLFSI